MSNGIGQILHCIQAGWYKNETVVVRTPTVLHLKLMCVPSPILGKTHPYLPTIIFRVALKFPGFSVQ